MYQHRNILCLLMFGALAGCSSVASVTTDNGDQAVASDAGARAPRNSDGSYILGPADRLRVKIYNDADMSGEYEINSAGFVSLPLVGQVKASGSTTSELEQNIAARMKGKIARDPKVNVEIAAYAPFYIYGEVKKAGEYPFRPGLTVADAVAIASGLTYRANERKIFIRHSGAAAEQVVTLDTPVRVVPGDNIRVSERMF